MNVRAASVDPIQIPMDQEAAASDAALAERYDLTRFELMLTRLSARFTSLRPSELGAAIDASVKSIVEALDIDRCTLLRLEGDGRSFTRINSFTRGGLRTAPLNERVFGYPWCIEKVSRGEAVIFTSSDELPPEAAIDKASLDKAGSQSMASIPLLVAGEIYGTVNFLCLDRRCVWTEELLSRVRLVAEVLGNAMARKHVQEEIEHLLAFERMLVEVTASLVSLPTEEVDAAIASGLRRTAEFLRVERATLWTLDRSAAEILPSHYWSSASASKPTSAHGRALPWLTARLSAGSVICFGNIAELQSAGSSQDRETLAALGTASLLALPLKVGGAVVAAISLETLKAHRDWPDALVPRVGLLGEVFATALARRQAERSMREAQADAAQHRERLAHVARLHTVGEMSAGIAHEINQPLVAIENYALAARKHASAGETANLAKVCELLDKIAAQSSRAGEVMRKLRTMVRRHEFEMKRIQIGQIVEDSLRFAEMEGHLNDVAITLHIESGLPEVIADDVQIQQVIVNLVRNAADAMSGAAGPEGKKLAVEVGAADEGLVFVRVADSGPGFADGDLDRIFEPFFSTKAAGLGIGLSLCRTIVEAHGGRMTAKPRQGGGAVLEFSLPTAEESER